MINKYSTIIWDWNGTLLDDVEFSIGVINKLLKKRSLPLIKSLKHYHSVFCFPITKYYENVGFDLINESFSDIAHEFVEEYYNNCYSLPLHKNVEAVLKKNKAKGIRQIILSATKKDILIKQVKPYKITHYFDELLGLDNVFAASKIDIGKEYIVNMGIKNAVIIGDTLHDKEVADALQFDCILFSGGHNSKDSLQKTSSPVINKLSEVFKFY